MELSATTPLKPQDIKLMTGTEIRQARADLGHLFGLGRPLRAAELGRLLRLKGRDPGATVLAWEAGDPISGPVSVAVEMMLDGARPPTFLDEFPLVEAIAKK